MENSNVPKGSNKNKETEIDLIELAQKIWEKRFFVLKVMAVFFIAGVFIAVFSAKEYTSTIVMVPQTGQTSKLGGLGGLASMAGINLSDLGGDDQPLSPTLYPQIMGSITFQKELMQTQVKFEKLNHPISVFDYYTKDEYKKTNILGTIIKYTIGLPSVILRSLKKKKEQITSDAKYITLTEDEKKVMGVLDKNVDLILNDKDGYITLSANGPEPLFATQLVISAQSLLQKYITSIKIEKVQDNLDFIQARFDDTKKEYEQTQRELASYQDFNRNVISAVSKIQEGKLINEYNLAFNVYSELAKQLEQAKIKVKDATPVLSIVQPAFVPIEKSKPKSLLIVFVCSLIGIMASCIYVLFKPILEGLGIFKKNGTSI